MVLVLIVVDKVVAHATEGLKVCELVIVFVLVIVVVATVVLYTSEP